MEEYNSKKESCYDKRAQKVYQSKHKPPFKASQKLQRIVFFIVFATFSIVAGGLMLYVKNESRVINHFYNGYGIGTYSYNLEIYIGNMVEYSFRDFDLPTDFRTEREEGIEKQSMGKINISLTVVVFNFKLTVIIFFTFVVQQVIIFLVDILIYFFEFYSCICSSSVFIFSMKVEWKIFRRYFLKKNSAGNLY